MYLRLFRGGGEYQRTLHAYLFQDDRQRAHFHSNIFDSFHFDPFMLRIESMNVTLQGLDSRTIEIYDSFTYDHLANFGKVSLVLVNSPFSGLLDFDAALPDLVVLARTREIVPRVLGRFWCALKDRRERLRKGMNLNNFARMHREAVA